MNILFFVVGPSLVLHQQAHFALRSVYLKTSKDDRIYVLTDSPALYTNIPFVSVEEITNDEIQQWKGSSGYFFRVKINAIRKFVSLHADNHLLFMDTDIFLHGSLTNIKEKINQGFGVMHKHECSMLKMKPNTEAGEMWKIAKGKVFAGITIGEEHHMWNSGVVAIPKDIMSDVMNKALAICDEMLANNVKCFVLEQWAISIALRHYAKDLLEAKEDIFHYWHYKYTWCSYISHFFVDAYSHYGYNVERELEAISKINYKTLRCKLMVKRTILKLLGFRY